jgi:hypothetical protein
MWTWSLNWGEITRRIVVGTCPLRPDDLQSIAQGAKASALFSLQHDDCHAYWKIDYEEMQRAGVRLGLILARCPIRDFDIHDMRRQLPQAIAQLAALQHDGHRTYVHCTAGLGRAPLTVLGYLTLVEGQDPEQAIQLILKGRPGAVPAWEAYHGCCQDLVTSHREAIEFRAYELYQRGANRDANADWYQARAEVLRSCLVPH